MIRQALQSAARYTKNVMIDGAGAQLCAYHLLRLIYKGCPHAITEQVGNKERALQLIAQQRRVSKERGKWRVYMVVS